jgi:hypothetical protein
MNRAILIGPVVFTLLGAAVGICLAMLYRQEPQERAHVYLDDSMPLVLLGAVAGALVGCGVSAACARWPGLVRIATVAFAALLGAAITAPLGWILGDMGAERLPREGMAAGAGIGGVMGLALGVAQMLLDRWRPSAAPGAAPDRGRTTAFQGPSSSSGPGR